MKNGAHKPQQIYPPVVIIEVFLWRGICRYLKVFFAFISCSRLFPYQSHWQVLLSGTIPHVRGNLWPYFNTITQDYHWIFLMRKGSWVHSLPYSHGRHGFYSTSENSKISLSLPEQCSVPTPMQKAWSKAIHFMILFFSWPIKPLPFFLILLTHELWPAEVARNKDSFWQRNLRPGSQTYSVVLVKILLVKSNYLLQCSDAGCLPGLAVSADGAWRAGWVQRGGIVRQKELFCHCW